MCVMLPDGPGPFPMVYLLHGLSDDHTAWQRWTTAELHCQRLGLGLALLDGDRSFYTDVPKTARQFASHILESVAFVDRTFRTRAAAGSRGIGGHSMGGYGAFKLGLSNPDIFGSVHAHSGAVDIVSWVKAGTKPDFADIWPTGRVPAHDDIRKLLAKPGRKPALYFDCGTEDFLLAHNRTIKADLVKRKIPHIYLEHPGAHDWGYWEAHLGEALDFHAGHFRKQGHSKG